jgi:hypothetical protein
MFRPLVVSFALVVCCPSILSAGTIYSNIGPGFPGDSLNVYILDGPTFAGTAFTTTGAGELATIFLGIGTTTSPATGGLYTNSSGEPGTLLESWTFSAPNVGFPSETLTSVAHPFLSSGTQYWFVLKLEIGQNGGWLSNDQAISGGIWLGSTADTLSQMFTNTPTPGIQLTSVPEPSSRILLVVVSFALLRRRFSWRAPHLL